MKSIILSVSTLVVMLGVVIATSFFVRGTLGKIEGGIEKAEINESSLLLARDEYTTLLAGYQRIMPWLSAVLPDSALYEIEACFFEVVSYAEAGEYASALAARGRLLSASRRARTLAEFSLCGVI